MTGRNASGSIACVAHDWQRQGLQLACVLPGPVCDVRATHARALPARSALHTLK